MPFAALPFAVTLAALPFASPTVGAAAQARDAMASTYDQATCAALRGELTQEGMDGWDRAAIGENAPATDDTCPIVAVQVARTAACADAETDPLLRKHFVRLFGDRFESCYLPRVSGNRAGVRAARGDESRKLPRLFLGQMLEPDTNAAPLPQPERRDTQWVLMQAHLPLPAPSFVQQLDAFADAQQLQSVSYEPVVPPPRS